MKTATSLALISVALLCGGCTHTSYQDTAGNKFSRTSFGTTQNIGKIQATAGDKSLVVEGYSNESAQVASAVVSAAVSAAAKAR